MHTLITHAHAHAHTHTHAHAHTHTHTHTHAPQPQAIRCACTRSAQPSSTCSTTPMTSAGSARLRCTRAPGAGGASRSPLVRVHACRVCGCVRAACAAPSILLLTSQLLTSQSPAFLGEQGQRSRDAAALPTPLSPTAPFPLCRHARRHEVHIRWPGAAARPGVHELVQAGVPQVARGRVRLACSPGHLRVYYYRACVCRLPLLAALHKEDGLFKPLLTRVYAHLRHSSNSSNSTEGSQTQEMSSNNSKQSRRAHRQPRRGTRAAACNQSCWQAGGRLGVESEQPAITYKLPDIEGG